MLFRVFLSAAAEPLHACRLGPRSVPRIRLVALLALLASVAGIPSQAGAEEQGQRPLAAAGQSGSSRDAPAGASLEAPERRRPGRPVEWSSPAATDTDDIAALRRIEVGRSSGVGSRANYRAIAGKEYVLDAYDELVVTVRGAKSEDWPLTVSPQGLITVPLVGAVRCAGMTIADFEKRLAEKLSRYLKDFSVAVVITRLRGIQVTITGQVEGPGSYSLPGLTTLWEAIQETGGITRAGSVRSVRIRDRHGKERTADLYPFLFGGHDESNPPLSAGDTVVVPVAERVVGLAGEVRSPALYEVKAGETLPQLLALGGGPTAQAALDKAYLLRVLPDRTKLILPVDLAAPQAQTNPQDLRDGDILVVPPIQLFLGTVAVSGEVRTPGKYARAHNMHLRDLLNLAGGCTAAALPAKTYIRRVREDRTLQVIWVDAARALAGDAEANIALMEGDEVIVPSTVTRAGVVAIRGEVMEEKAQVPFAPGMTARDLLGIAGGLTVRAAPAQAYIERLSGAGGPKRILWFDAGRALQGVAADNVALQDGDLLTVPAVRTYLGKVTVTGELRALTTPRARSRRDGQGDALRAGLAADAEADTPAGTASQALYDLSEGMRVSDLVKLAGGPTAMAALQRARLVRVGPNGLRESLRVNLDTVLNNVGGEEDLVLRDGDSLDVPSISVLQKSVRVAGELVGTGVFGAPVAGETAVKRRGLYELKEGDTVRDLVQAVGGVTAYAALRAARIDRQRPDGTTERIGVDLYRLLVEKDETANVTLQNGDEFTVPAIADMVYVVGAVNNPGAYEYREGNNRVMDMIARAGGASPRAVLSSVRVVRSDMAGKQDPVRVNMDAVMKRGKIQLDPGVRAGDVIIVPEKPIMAQDVFQWLANISLLRFYLGQ